MKHFLKILPEYFDDVVSSKKKVEIREEVDRSFEENDILVLEEWDKSKGMYTGNKLEVKVTHCLRGSPYVPLNYVALSIEII